jgi:hypothetical protein
MLTHERRPFTGKWSGDLHETAVAFNGGRYDEQPTKGPRSTTQGYDGWGFSRVFPFGPPVDRLRIVSNVR